MGNWEKSPQIVCHKVPLILKGKLLWGIEKKPYFYFLMLFSVKSIFFLFCYKYEYIILFIVTCQ